MTTWNVIATVNGDKNQFEEARELLTNFGHVEPTHYFNVLTMDVPDIQAFLDEFALFQANFPHITTILSRLMPLTTRFTFQTPEQFLETCGDAVRGFAPDLAGKRFHVRLHRRGFKGRIVTPETERALDAFLRTETARRGAQADVAFDDWEAVVVVETIDSHGGAGVWTVEEGMRYPFLKLD